MTNNSSESNKNSDNAFNNKCSHCGAEELEGGIMKCHSYAKTHANAGFRSLLCREREKRQKAEEQYLEMAEASSEVPDLVAEVERLRANLRRAVEIGEKFTYEDWPDNRVITKISLRYELGQLKANLNPDKK